MKYLKKLLSLLLIAVMVAGMLPAYAASTDTQLLKQAEDAGLLDYLTVTNLNEQVTRLDAAKLVAGLAELEIKAYRTFPYTDCTDLTEKERQIIVAVSNAELLKGNESGYFSPNSTITRAEVATILYRYHSEDYSDKYTKFYTNMGYYPDVASTAWYAGYVNYCVSAGIIRDPGYFYPNSKITFDVALRWMLNAKTPVVPVTPTVTASNVASTGKIKLTWDKIDNADKYEVYRATSETGKYTLIKTTTSTSFTNTSTTAGTTYYYKVRALDGDLVSEFSEVVSRICDLAQPKVKIELSSKGNPKLTWGKVDGAVKYEVYRATSEKGTYKLIKTTTSTSFTNTSVTEGKTYYYKVKAIAKKSAANSAYSEIVVRIGKLEQPKVTGSNAAASGKVKLTWDKVDNAEKYEVYRATSKSGKYTLMKTTTGTSYTNTSATVGKTYYYKVRAVAGTIKSDYSEIVTRTCDLAQPEVKITLSSKGNPKLTWDKVDGAVKYEVYRATSKSGTYDLIKTTTSTSFTNTSITEGKTYYYKVRAIAEKSAANSAYSEVASIKIAGEVDAKFFYITDDAAALSLGAFKDVFVVIGVADVNGNTDPLFVAKDACGSADETLAALNDFLSDNKNTVVTAVLSDGVIAKAEDLAPVQGDESTDEGTVIYAEKGDYYFFGTSTLKIGTLALNINFTTTIIDETGVAISAEELDGMDDIYVVYQGTKVVAIFVA